MAETSLPLTANEQIELWQSFIWKLAYRYADKHSPNRSDSVSETFSEIVVSALHYWPNYDPEKGSFSNWMAWIARSRFLCRLVRRRRTLPTVTMNTRSAVSDDQDWMGGFPDTRSPDVGDEIDARSRRLEVNAAIEQLTAEEQDVVRDHFWSGTPLSSCGRAALASAKEKLKGSLGHLREDTLEF